MTDRRTESAAGAIMDSRYGWNRELSILEAEHRKSALRDAMQALAAADRWDQEHGILRIDTRDEATIERLVEALRGIGHASAKLTTQVRGALHTFAAAAGIAQEEKTGNTQALSRYEGRLL